MQTQSTLLINNETLAHYMERGRRERSEAFIRLLVLLRRSVGRMALGCGRCGPVVRHQ